MDDKMLLKRWVERWFRQSRVLDSVKERYGITADDALSNGEKQHETKAYRKIMQILSEKEER